MINPKLWLPPQPALGPGSEFQLAYLLAMLTDPRGVRVLVIGTAPQVRETYYTQALCTLETHQPSGLRSLEYVEAPYCSPPLRQSLCGIWDNDEDIK